MAISFSSAKNFASGTNANQIAKGDFNRDGQLDLVIDSSTRKQMQVSVLLGSKDGNFSKATTFSLREQGSAKSIVTGDFNRDGRLDVVTLSDGVTVLLGDGQGHLKSPTRFFTGASSVAVTKGDFNGDGKLDLAVATNSSEYSPSSWGVTVLLNNGKGRFKPMSKISVKGEPTGISAGDFNGDGKLDIATTGLACSSTTDGNYCRYNNHQVSVLLNDGSARFPKLINTPSSFNEQLWHYDWGEDWIVTADLNGDGKLDAVSNLYESRIRVMLGKGTGALKRTSFSRLDARSAVAGDFDGDRHTDLATVPVNDASGVSVLLGDGSGRFNTPLSFEMGGKTESVAVVAADFNRDGQLDLATANGTGQGVSVWLNTSRGDHGNGIVTLRGERWQGNQASNQSQPITGDDALTGLNRDALLLGGEATYHSSQRSDQTLDFTQDTDKILLDPDIFVRLSNSQQVSFASVKTIAAAKSSPAFITYVPETGCLYYNENGTAAGFGAGGLFAAVDKGRSLTANDFCVISGARI